MTVVICGPMKDWSLASTGFHPEGLDSVNPSLGRDSLTGSLEETPLQVVGLRPLDPPSTPSGRNRFLCVKGSTCYKHIDDRHTLEVIDSSVKYYSSVLAIIWLLC